MDRWRAAGALLALAACFACSAAAPTATNQTALDLYEASSEGCYYNFQHYGEGDRIMTNEPCLNCTCHNRMLMCYLRVCPFTKPIGQDCTVEKRADQCCPIVTCPDVPVDLLTSTSTTSPAEYGATGLGKLDKYGCSINGKYFPEGSKVPPTPNKPCEHCYCIRNMTTCVMQECTLHVDGCTPIYHKDVCCPVRYSCDHPEDEIPLLDDMSTTVRPTPGFLLTTTTVSPVTQMTQDCVHNDQIIADGASITTEKACEHCYCMKGDIVCVVQECGAPMENEGKNCTSLPPREGQCCPDTYICEGDDLSSDISTDSTTDINFEKLTTLSPPRRGGVEGSGYRIEPSEGTHTDAPTIESELEGSGDEQEPTQSTDINKHLMSEKPIISEEMTPGSEDADQYIPVTTKTPPVEENSVIPDNGLEQVTVEPDTYQSTTYSSLQEDLEKVTSEATDDKHIKPLDHVTTADSSTPANYEKVPTESGETVTDIAPVQEHEKPSEYTPSTSGMPVPEESSTIVPHDDAEGSSSPVEQEENKTTIRDEISKTTISSIIDAITGESTEKAIAEMTTGKENVIPENYPGGTTSAPALEESITHLPKESEEAVEKESSKPELDIHSTTSSPSAEVDRLTTEPDHAENTVAVNEEGYIYPRPSSEEFAKSTPSAEEAAPTEKIMTEDRLVSHTHLPTTISVHSESYATTYEPDKGLNTIPSEIEEESSSQLPLNNINLSSETKSTESSSIIDMTEEPQQIDLMSPTTMESLMPSSEGQTTKADQYTVTTEPTFRREDEVIVSTEKPKEPTPTTIKPEFVDEGLIPTSTHEQKLSTGSEISTVDEDITTLMPEYIDGALDSKKPTTESSITPENLPEKVTEMAYEQEYELSSSTTKPMDVTTHVETYEEPSRIPGEGDCLLNGVTYRNNSVVPNTNNCHTGCKCSSSIIKCDPIICMPPPDYMDNCQSIYDTPDACCPTYVCDHPKETVPPQSDNQMSGTEPPAPPPVIECRGDQCELNEPTQMPTGLPDLKPETIECGPEGCADVKEPIPPFTEQSGCTDEKCVPARLPSTDSQISPIKPCEGDKCKKVPDMQSASCKGDSCTNLECENGSCDSNVGILPQDNLQTTCKEEDGCKPEESTTPDCTGDLPCRRKDIPGAEGLPSKCEGSECEFKPEMQPDLIQTAETPSTETIKPSEEEEEKLSETEPVQDLSTRGPVMIDETEGEAKKPDIVKLDEETSTHPGLIEETSTKVYDIIDKEHTEKTLIMDEKYTTGYAITEKYTDNPTLSEEKITKMPEVEKIETDKPDFAQMEGTGMPSVEEKHTEKPVSVEEENTKVPEVVEEYTTEPAVIVEEDTNAPTVTGEHTDKPDSIYTEGTKMPYLEKHTDKPVLDKEESTKVPSVVEESSDRPGSLEDDDTKTSYGENEHTGKPVFVEKEYTEAPKVTLGQDEKEGTIAPEDIEEHTDKLSSVDKEGAKVTDVPEEQTDKPDLFEGTKIPDGEEKSTDKPILVEEIDTESPQIAQDHSDKPGIAEQEKTEEPTSTENEDSRTPQTHDEKDTEKPVSVEEESTKGAEGVEEYTKPATIEEGDTEIPKVTAGYTYTPVLTKGESTSIPDATEDLTRKPVLAEAYTHKPDTKVNEPTEEQTIKPTLIEADTTNSPDYEYTSKPISDERTKIPNVAEEQTSKPDLSEKEYTKTSDITEKQTDKPDSVTTDLMKEPDFEEKTIRTPALASQTDAISDIHHKYTNKPALTEEESMAITVEPDVVTDSNVLPENDKKEKPILVDEDLPETPTILKDVSKPAYIDSESSTKPTIAESETEYSSIIEDDKTRKPLIIEDSLSSVDNKEKYEPELTTDQTLPIHEDGEEKPGEPHSKHTTLPALEPMLEVTSEQPEYVPQTTNGDITRRTEGEVYTNEPVKSAVTETQVDDHTVPIDTEKSTEKPADELNTTKFDDDSHTESNLSGIDVRIPETDLTGVKVSTTPISASHSEHTNNEIQEMVTQTLTEEEKTTKVPLSEGEVDTPYHITTSEKPTIGLQDATSELTDKITESPEFQTITEQEEIYTNMPEQESSVTKSPEQVIIEPQEGPFESPDVIVTGADETTSKTIEKEVTSGMPQSLVTQTAQNNEGSSETPLSEIPKATDIPEITETETQKTDLLEPHEDGSDKTPPHSLDLSGVHIKPVEPEIFTPEKEEMITSTVSSTVTESVKDFTQKEDSIVTGEIDTATKYHETTERFEIIPTRKSDESSDSASTDSQEAYTEEPILSETKPNQIGITNTITTESYETPQKAPDSSKPIDHEQTPEISQLETKAPDSFDLPATKSPTSVITEFSEEADQKEKTTISPETGIPEDHTTTESPDSYVTESAQPEQPIEKEPESLGIPKTTALPDTPVTVETGVTQAPELLLTTPHDTNVNEQEQKLSTEFATEFTEASTELPHAHVSTESSLSLSTESEKDSITEKDNVMPTLHEIQTESSDQTTEKPDYAAGSLDVTTPKQSEEVTSSADHTPALTQYSETTPYLIELEEHTHKIEDDISFTSSSDLDITTPSLNEEEQTPKTQENTSTELPPVDYTTKAAEDTSAVSASIDVATTSKPESEVQGLDTAPHKGPEEDIDTMTMETELSTKPSGESLTSSGPVVYQTTETVHETGSEKLPDISTPSELDQSEKTTPLPPPAHDILDADQTDVTTLKSQQDSERTTPTVDHGETEKSPITESYITSHTEKEILATEKPLTSEASRRTTVPEEEMLFTTKATPEKEEEHSTPVTEDKYSKPEKKPISEVGSSELPKPPTEMQPTDETAPDEEGQFPQSGYGEPDYVEEDQAFGPGTCRYGGKVYVSAQQIPRDDPCDFCFCFRSDIICLQQSCPPPIHGCHEEPIQGFCCPRYECPVSMATSVNVTTTTTTTTTTLPPHFPTHSYKGAAQRRGCQIKGHTYKVGEVVRSSSGPCLHCTCGGDGQMKCDPKACTPEPMLRQMIAAAVSAKRRR